MAAKHGPHQKQALMDTAHVFFFMTAFIMLADLME
jgi:hypothetical protein